MRKAQIIFLAISVTTLLASACDPRTHLAPAREIPSNPQTEWPGTSSPPAPSSSSSSPSSPSSAPGTTQTASSLIPSVPRNPIARIPAVALLELDVVAGVGDRARSSSRGPASVSLFAGGRYYFNARTVRRTAAGLRVGDLLIYIDFRALRASFARFVERGPSGPSTTYAGYGDVRLEHNPSTNELRLVLALGFSYLGGQRDARSIRVRGAIVTTHGASGSGTPLESFGADIWDLWSDTFDPWEVWSLPDVDFWEVAHGGEPGDGDWLDAWPPELGEAPAYDWQDVDPTDVEPQSDPTGWPSSGDSGSGDSGTSSSNDDALFGDDEDADGIPSTSSGDSGSSSSNSDSGSSSSGDSGSSSSGDNGSSSSGDSGSSSSGDSGSSGGDSGGSDW
jgi:hypothetical protein